MLDFHRDGTASINRASVPAGELPARLRATYDGRPDKVLFVKADPHLRYAAVVDAVDVARCGSEGDRLAVTDYFRQFACIC